MFQSRNIISEICCNDKIKEQTHEKIGAVHAPGIFNLLFQSVAITCSGIHNMLSSSESFYMYCNSWVFVVLIGKNLLFVLVVMSIIPTRT